VVRTFCRREIARLPVLRVGFTVTATMIGL
jgi:hypothetical protein